MATGKKLPNMPIELHHVASPIKVGKKQSPILVGCDYKNIILTTGLFVAPTFIRGINGQFWFDSLDAKTDIYKDAMSNGVFLITSDARLFKHLRVSAESEFTFDGSAKAYKYLTAAGLVDASFLIDGENSTLEQTYPLRSDNAFVVDGIEPIATISKDAHADGAICVRGVALVDKISYASSDGDFVFSGEASAIMFGYEGYIPADYDDYFVDADGEDFVVVRSDDDGV